MIGELRANRLVAERVTFSAAGRTYAIAAATLPEPQVMVEGIDIPTQPNGSGGSGGRHGRTPVPHATARLGAVGFVQCRQGFPA
ncbi:hypothetical protein [Nocardia sp. CC227C]|uniref:hypothetical protein n=1 Tax=Nocardia sp. CC227C TaxID=3044562 RepID=UPI00278C6A5C|nr:hypothetical protein [Nocardia sp. CC227C]